ncbi:MAG: hypothetical protein GY774_19730 [Planctomycetes bacterium]|nr:hypothetical protein [Planctomycetota bacterium]
MNRVLLDLHNMNLHLFCRENSTFVLYCEGYALKQTICTDVQCDSIQPKNTIEIKSGHLIISSFGTRYAGLPAEAGSAFVAKDQGFGKEIEDEKNHKCSVFIRPVAANGFSSRKAAV